MPETISLGGLALRFIQTNEDGLGSLTLFAGEDIALAPGETVFIERGVVHAFRNDSQAPATCLCMLTPGLLGPAYFREMAALIGAGAPDPAKMKTIMLRYGLIPDPGA
jgi:hypothetical protein